MGAGVGRDVAFVAREMLLFLDDADNEHTVELAPGRSFFRAAAPTKEDLRRFHDCREERTRFLVSIFDLVQNCASPWWCLPPLPQVDRTKTSL